MNVLIAYDGFEVEYCDNKYYHNFLNDIIRRYSIFGDLYITLILKKVSTPSCDEVNLDAVKVVPLKKINTLKGLLCHMKNNKKTIRDAVSQCDFIIGHVPSDVACDAISIAKKQGKPTFAMVIGCPWDALWNYNWKGKLLAPLEYLRCRRTVAKSDFAQYVTSVFLQTRYPSKKEQLGCSDVCIYSRDVDAAKNIQNRWFNSQKNNDRNIVTCATIGAAYKGQAYVIRAIAKLNKMGYSYHYHLYGGGSPERLKALSISEGVEQYVHIYGEVPHDKIVESIKSMDIYAQPSLQEGLPRSVIEAMSVGLPIIASDNVGGMNELTLPQMRFRKKCVADIAKILQYNNDEWIKASVHSIVLSEKYEYNYLQTIRDKFYHSVLEMIKNNKDYN